jgi:hypothetical protein
MPKAFTVCLRVAIFAWAAFVYPEGEFPSYPRVVIAASALALSLTRGRTSVRSASKYSILIAWTIAMSGLLRYYLTGAIRILALDSWRTDTGIAYFEEGFVIEFTVLPVWISVLYFPAGVLAASLSITGVAAFRTIFRPSAGDLRDVTRDDGKSTSIEYRTNDL